MSDANAITELADRFFAAIEAGDIAGVEACYAPDAVIWVNVAEAEQSVPENLRVLGWLSKNLGDRRYAIRLREILHDGFLQQHELTGMLASGDAFSMPACLVVKVENGQITRLDEYLDSARVAALSPARSG